MRRRTFLLGAAALVSMPSTANARAWGASGYMTKRVRAAEDAGRQAFRDGKQFSENPFPNGSHEHRGWSDGFVGAGNYRAMTPDEVAAYKAHKQLVAEQTRRVIDDFNRDMRNGMIVFGVIATGFVASMVWLVVSTLDGDAQRKRDAEGSPGDDAG